MSADKHMDEQLSAYLDGELDADQAARLEAALASDSQLADRLQRLRRTRAMLRALPRAKAPEDFVSHVLAQAERLRLVVAPEQAPRALPWVRWAAAAAVVAIAATAGIVVVNTLVQSGHMAAVKGTSAKPPPLLAKQDRESRNEDTADRASGHGLVRYGNGTKDLDDSTTAAGLARSHELNEGRGRTEALLRNGTFEVAAASRPASEVRLVIYTDDLPAARAQVESALTCNGFYAYASATAPSGKAVTAELANRYRRSDNDDRVQYELDGTPQQVQQVQLALEDVQQKQRVSQSPREPAPAMVIRSGRGAGPAPRGASASEREPAPPGESKREDIAPAADTPALVPAAPARAAPAPAASPSPGVALAPAGERATAAPASAPASEATSAPTHRYDGRDRLAKSGEESTLASAPGESPAASQGAGFAGAQKEYARTVERLLVTLEYRPAETRRQPAAGALESHFERTGASAPASATTEH